MIRMKKLQLKQTFLWTKMSETLVECIDFYVLKCQSHSIGGIYTSTKCAESNYHRIVGKL